MGSQSTLTYPVPRGLFACKERMMAFIAEHWRLNRSAVSPDTDKLIAGLCKAVPSGGIIEARSGEDCLGWLIPQCWRVRHGRLLKPGGEVLADFARNPLFLWTHCVGFRGEVSREELLKHVASEPSRPEDTLYRYLNGYRYGVREWGISLPHRLVENLLESRYNIDIDAELDDNGTLKVFNAFLPGRRPETIFFAAHTCHPAQVSDGLANIAVLLELYRHLAELPEREYSYRFIFGPEYFGAAAYLAKAPGQEVAALRWGLYCDMLSSHEPIGWQSSFRGNSRIDAILENVLPTHAACPIRRGYRKLWGNDEMFYNGPGVDIPTAGLGRGMHREYHFDVDDLEAADPYHLVEALWILMRIAGVFETDRVPERKFRGPLYLSRHGLYADATLQRRQYDALEAMQILMDGCRSLLDIAREADADFFFIREAARRMEERKLIALRPVGQA